MTYEFENTTTPFDFWRLSMSRTYRSTAGICNIIFTVAMWLLTAKIFSSSGDVMQVLLFFGCILFPVIQPIGVMIKAKAQASLVPKNMHLKFDEEGLHVTVGDKSENIKWKNLTSVVKQAHLVIIFSDARHGYMLSNRVLGNEKDAFFAFAKSRIKQGK